MKKIVLVLSIALPFIVFSQTLTRKRFDYTKLKTDTLSKCSDTILYELGKSYTALEENKSKVAVEVSKGVYDVNKQCPRIYEVYGYSLFRGGEWLEGVNIIEKGIEKFGSIPDLIKVRSEMSLEMAQLGTTVKNVDGNSVYKAKSLDDNEEQFKQENFKSALCDLEYLMNRYHGIEETFYVAKVYQLLKEYDKSTVIYKRLLKDEDYRSSAIFNIADNYINQGKLDEAEKELIELVLIFPKDGSLYEKMAEIYELRKDEELAKELKRKATFYSNIPASSDLQYNDENYNLLLYFASEEEGSKKIKKLNTIYKTQSQNYTIDICLMILKLHTNHGNGLEERATEILSKIGAPAIDKVNQLFQSKVSTCTITNLAEIMATVKDEKSWEFLKEYLPSIANLPMTTIPPRVPEMILKFDQEKGLREVLTIVKPLLDEDKPKSDNTTSFWQYIYYSPLKKINHEKLIKTAKELSYSQEEISRLVEKLK